MVAVRPMVETRQNILGAMIGGVAVNWWVMYAAGTADRRCGRGVKVELLGEENEERCGIPPNSFYDELDGSHASCPQ